MDNSSTVVLICSLPASVESRSGLLLLLLVVVDFYHVADLQIVLQSKKLTFEDIHASENLLIALKTEATQVEAKPFSQSQCSALLASLFLWRFETILLIQALSCISVFFHCFLAFVFGRTLFKGWVVLQLL